MSSSDEDDSEDDSEEEYGYARKLRGGDRSFSYIVSGDVLDLQLPASKPGSPYVLSAVPEDLPPLPLSPVFELPSSIQARPPVSTRSSSYHQLPVLSEELSMLPPSTQDPLALLPAETALPVSRPCFSTWFEYSNRAVPAANRVSDRS
jgi:hypothetical protein